MSAPERLALDPEPTGSMSLDELVASARDHHGAVLACGERARRAMGAGLLHAILAGEALNEARRRLPAGEWDRWVAQNVPYSTFTVRKYQRIAYYRSEVEEWVRGGLVQQVDDAWRALSSRPNPHARDSSVEQMEARRRYQAGESAGQIGEALGIAETTVREWVDPNWRSARRERDRGRRNQRRAERRRMAEAELQERVEAIGGPLSVGFVLIGQAESPLCQAVEEAPPGEDRVALEQALAAVRRARRQMALAVEIRSAAEEGTA